MTTPDPAVIEAMANAALHTPIPDGDDKALYMAEVRAAFAALPPAYRHGPELLDALKALVAWADYSGNLTKMTGGDRVNYGDIEKARAAIAKVEAER